MWNDWENDGRKALTIAREHRMKSSTQTNQQSIFQMRSHSGYGCMITIFKLPLNNAVRSLLIKTILE